MYPVSEQYKKDMKDGFRNRSFIRIYMGIFDVDASSEALFTDNGHTENSIVQSINDNNLVEQTYTRMEKNLIRLNATQYFFPTNGVFYESGYNSLELSNSDCTFTNNPVISVGFENSHDVAGLTINFYEDYPTDFIVRAYNKDVLVDTATITDNEKLVFNGRVNLSNFDKLEVEFVKTKFPHRSIKISTLDFGIGIIVDNKDVITSTHTESVHPVSLEVPKYSLNFDVYNRDNIYNPFNADSLIHFLQENQTLSLSYGYTLNNGTVEWVNSGEFYLAGWKRAKDGETVSFSCDDVFSLLQEEYYKGSGTNTLATLATNVLTEYGIEKYYLDPVLETISTTIPPPVGSANDTLKFIANMGRCRMFRNYDGTLSLESTVPPVTTVEYVGEYPTVDNPDNLLNMETKQYTFIDHNFIKLDGKQYFLADDMVMADSGFVSNELSNDFGKFTINPSVTVLFQSRYSSFGMKLDFGDTFPKKIKITAIGDDFNYSKEFTLTDRYFILNRILLKVNSIKVEFLETVLPNQRVRLNGMIDFGRETDFTLSLKEHHGHSQVDVLPMLKQVEVNHYRLTTDNVVTEVYNEDLEVNGTLKLHLVFNDITRGVSVVGTGITVSSYTVYDNACDLVLNGTGLGNLTITGTVYTKVAGKITLAVSHYGEIVTIDNPLIDNVKTAVEVAEWVRDYALLRKKYVSDYQGNPEINAGDVIYIENGYVADDKAVVLDNTIKFGGALTGTITVRG